jgi:protein arginine kinase activator
MSMHEQQICFHCKQNPAKVKLTKLIKGTVEEVYLCQECAARHSPYQKKLPTEIDDLLANILTGKVASTEGAAKVASPTSDTTCSTCGLPFGTYRETLLLGCSDCYESFDKLLQTDLRKLHGSTNHRGRVPDIAPPAFDVRRSPQELRKRLQDAVKAEDFELAARLRDEIRSLENLAANDNK